MKKKRSGLLTALIVIFVILLLSCIGLGGFLWYQNSHVFVENKAYPKNAAQLDLTAENISFAHYDSLHAQLPNCDILWNVPLQGNLWASNSETVSVSTLTKADADILCSYFPKLKTLSAETCRDYTELEALKARNPKFEILYYVDLGGSYVEPDTEELELLPEDYSYEVLSENLIHLKELKRVELRKPELTEEQVAALQERCPDVQFSCTVELMGEEYDTQAKVLDLSAMQPDQVAEIARKLSLLPTLETVELMDAQGKSALSKADVKTLMDAAPQAAFHYTFDFYGVTLSTDMDSAHIVNKRIGDAGEADLRLALDLMPKCQRFVLEYCSISNDILAQIREDYRGRTKVVWRVLFGKGSTLTDAEVIRAVYDLVDDNSHDLVYCEDVRFLDIGHDEFLDYVDFIAGMPNLEYAIVSGSPIKDLSPFANCKKLKVLEAGFCEYLTDASPLAACTELEMLNISYTHITDLSPLDDLKLTTMFAMYPGRSRVSEEEQARFKEQHPDCLAKFVGDQPYGTGWRYTADGERLDWYALITAAFRYPDAPNHVGWYFKEDEA